MKRGARRLVIPLFFVGALAVGACGWRSDVAASVDGTDIGMPPATAAGRAGFCPAPACSTWPMIT